MLFRSGAFNDWQALEWQHIDKYAGFVEAHRHLIDLRQNTYDNTAGLVGQHTAVFHQDDNNHVIGYHRWKVGGPGDDVLIITNFSNKTLHDYHLALPLPGTWTTRFNSSWKGYSPDFTELPVNTIGTQDTTNASVDLAPYSIIIFSQ